MSMIYPFHSKVEDKLLLIYDRAEKIWQTTFDFPRVSYARLGKVAGRAKFKSNEIILNPDYFIENETEMIESTVPHEAAHLIAYKIDPIFGKDHGPRWRSVMVWLGQRPDRCHCMDSTIARVRQTKQFLYKCEQCGEIVKMGLNRHRKMMAGTRRYIHSRCNGKLISQNQMA